jgi:hypothetical protein
MSGSGKIRARLILTVRYIEALKANPAGPYCVSDLRTAGLLLRVAPSGERTWPLSYRITRGPKQFGTRPWADMTILEPLWRRRGLAPTS